MTNFKQFKLRRFRLVFGSTICSMLSFLITSALLLAQPSVTYYMTDSEGVFDRFSYFFQNADPREIRFNPLDRKLWLAPHVRFIFGGDATDCGPNGLQILSFLLQAHADYPKQVELMIGNRDLNKVRILLELIEMQRLESFRKLIKSNSSAFEGGELALSLYLWFEANGAGAKHGGENALVWIQKELMRERGGHVGLDEAAQRYLGEISPHGLFIRYLMVGKLAFEDGNLLVTHADINEENVGFLVDTMERVNYSRWINRINDVLRTDLTRVELALHLGNIPGDSLALNYGGGRDPDIAKFSLTYPNRYRVDGGIGVHGMAVERYFNQAMSVPMLRLYGHTPQPGAPKLTVLPGGGAVYHGDLSRSDIRATPLVRIIQNPQSRLVEEFRATFLYEQRKYEINWSTFANNKPDYRIFPYGFQTTDGFFVNASDQSNTNTILLTRYGENYTPQSRLVSRQDLEHTTLSLPMNPAPPDASLTQLLESGSSTCPENFN